MRSADGLDACFALSTACPNADSGRAAAAAASPEVARNERRPLLAFMMTPRSDARVSLFDFEDEDTTAGVRHRPGVHRAGRHEAHLRRGRRCSRGEDQFDGVTDMP